MEHVGLPLAGEDRVHATFSLVSIHAFELVALSFNEMWFCFCRSVVKLRSNYIPGTGQSTLPGTCSQLRFQAFCCDISVFLFHILVMQRYRIRFILFYFILFYFIIIIFFNLILIYFILFYFILFYFILLYFTLLYFILLLFIYLFYFYFII